MTELLNLTQEISGNVWRHFGCPVCVCVCVCVYVCVCVCVLGMVLVSSSE